VLTVIFAISTYFFWRKANQAQKQIKLSRELAKKFMNTVPHQFRPPLTLLKGYSSMILEGDYGPIKPELSDVFHKMSVSTNNLIDIVDDYLDLTTLKLGNVQYGHEEIDVKGVLEQLIHKFRQNKLSIDLKLKESGNAPYLISGDTKQITAVFRRLIENAVKYTPKGGVIVNLSKNEKSVSVSIEDTGIGIAKSDRPNIFNESYRALNAKDTSAVGTGLGLYINSQVIKAHHGRIWAESEGIFKGAKFFVELPVCTVR